MAPPPPIPGSPVLLDEYFASADDRFLDELLRVRDAAKLAGLADRWKVDPRPWAQAMQDRYLAAPWRTPGHNVVVKRLFKEAERRADWPRLAAFVQRFDCLVRRSLVRRGMWDPASRQYVTWESLRMRSGGIVGTPPPRSGAEPRLGDGDDVMFSVATRLYVRRRALRSLRRLGYDDPARYVEVATQALRRYRDDDLATGQDILDSYCLLRICYGRHEALRFGRSHAALVEGRALAELTPAPRFAAAWQAEAAGGLLLDLVADAGARLVRKWAIAMLREHHQALLRRCPPARLLRLFDHDDDEVQSFAATALAMTEHGGAMGIDDWLRLLRTRSLLAMPLIVDAMRSQASLDQLTLAQCLELARREPTPVAALGLDLVCAHPEASSSPDAIVQLAEVTCAVVAREAVTWALGVLGDDGCYSLARLTPFFDARLRDVRQAAFAWLSTHQYARDDAALLARLLETPFDDVRLSLVQRLRELAAAPAEVGALVPLWTSVLLNVHRGGRAKVQALHQLARAAAASPESVPALLPVFAVAVRSVRPAEARIGLAALVQAAERVPALQPQVLAAFPELRFVSEGATS